MPKLDVAILTDSRFTSPISDNPYNCQIFLEEAWVAHYLRELGLTVARVPWDEPGYDWTQVRAAVFRSTWDYFDRFAEFEPWLNTVANQTLLVNRFDLITWNMDKHYLRDLAEQDVDIVPTKFVEKGESINLLDALRGFMWQEAVIKPAVSGAARLTYRVNTTNAIAYQSILDECLKNEAMMIQPFMASVLEQGEVSLMVFDGKVTHAIRKTPKAGDFRVQDDHGGVVHPYFPSPAEIEFAERAVAACPAMPNYARVDVVQHHGKLRIMELELLEPELFFRFCPPAAARLAASIQQVLR
ncbi:glutathione synthase/RimK-type ligase-like ATP-grasp enzyme [Chitinivorax tropicus]|uniref:Glutathione synthase/RimK-type ligase-like ATP-grasp enzyme n=1 Tax=Chitinivorax tropicus TaxID=714531 RepID=A0A840MM77_9PROT|nr:glutathione synthase/RimK-type ligase-like ATP-grasp enzyme [Chitinivorax tropicus]